jgi:prolyl-tRNA synthetase
MYDAYVRIFTRTGLTFRRACRLRCHRRDVSQEFMVLASSGEDAIVFSDGDDYAANLEAAVALPPAGARPAPGEVLKKVPTPGARTIEDLASFLKLPPTRLVKTLIVDGAQKDNVVALVVRGDHELNAVKAQKLPGVASPLRMASAERVLAATGTAPGYVGLVTQVPHLR